MLEKFCFEGLRETQKKKKRERKVEIGLTISHDPSRWRHLIRPNQYEP